MMRILVVTLLYMPDGGPSAPLYGMLCEELAQRGHQVSVIAAVPHYLSGTVPSQFRGKWIQPSYEHGVRVIRIRVPSVQRTDLKKRAVQFIGFQLGAMLAGLRQDYDVLLISNPALEVWLPFILLSVLRCKPAVFSVHDVYPDVGVSLGIFRSKLIVSVVGYLERFCLDRSSKVRILSESFIKPLRSLGVTDDKMELVYDWVDTDLIKPLPKDNNFAREHQLVNHFVVLYAGNIGLSQGLEQVLAVAELLQDQEEIKFVLVGDGAGRAPLMTEASRLNLGNVRFLPFQPRNRLPEVLATADVSLVTLKKGVGAASLPSKSFSILASGRPILASVDEGSDTWNLVKRSQAGICVPPEDPGAIARAILELKNDERLRNNFGKKGRDYALQYHSPQAAAVKFEQLLLAALASH
ncbi:MAG: glycosyltransferase family 4 protein [Desulfobaccales bacterium]